MQFLEVEVLCVMGGRETDATKAITLHYHEMSHRTSISVL